MEGEWGRGIYFFSPLPYAPLFTPATQAKTSRQTTLGRFGFKQSIPHRDKVTEMKIPDFVSTKNIFNCILFTNFQLKTIFFSKSQPQVYS